MTNIPTIFYEISIFREAFLIWMATILVECHVKQCLTVLQLSNAALWLTFVPAHYHLMHLKQL